LVDEEKESLSQIELDYFLRQQSIELNRFSSSQGVSSSQDKPKTRQKTTGKKEKAKKVDDEIEILDTPVKSTNKNVKKQVEEDDDDVIIISPEKRTPSVKRKQPIKDSKSSAITAEAKIPKRQSKQPKIGRLSEASASETSMNSTISEPAGKKPKTKLNETIDLELEMDCTLIDEPNPKAKPAKSKANKNSKPQALKKVDTDDEMPDLDF
jgi:hypothetical protein